MKINEVLFKTILNDGYNYTDRYIFNGKIEDLEKYGFIRLNEGDVVEEVKTRVGKDQVVYYKKSGLGYFVAFIEDGKMVFMSGVPIWWIGDEEETNYYDDINLMIKDGIINEAIKDVKNKR